MKTKEITDCALMLRAFAAELAKKAAKLITAGKAQPEKLGSMLAAGESMLSTASGALAQAELLGDVAKDLERP